jgi:hypothetical protein
MGLRAGLVIERREKCLVLTGIRTPYPPARSIVAILRRLILDYKPRKQKPSNIRQTQNVSTKKPDYDHMFRRVLSHAIVGFTGFYT